MRYPLVAAALAALAVLPTLGCSGVQKAMDDLNKPAPKADVPNVTISTNSSRAFDGGATEGGDGGGTDGTCEKACARYLECKKVDDAAAKTACGTKCAGLKRTPKELGQLQSAECDAALAMVDGTSFGPGIAAGAKVSCPPPVGAQRTPEEESVLALATAGKSLCGKAGGREWQLKLGVDGTMTHTPKGDAKGEGFAPLSVAPAGGDRYCWRFSQGNLMASPDGATFTGVGTKPDGGGKGPVAFQTKGGEYKACP